METQAEYYVRASKVFSFEEYFKWLLNNHEIRHNGDWNEYERGKAIARSVCQSDNEYNEAVQIIAAWVGV